jgi:N-methylhydantoinase A/acetophenone carboxylase
MGHTIDIDTGGTFTDGFFVFQDRVASVKVPTTPHDLTVCFLSCIEAGAERLGIPVEDLLYETEVIRFSNTIGTNTIIQRDGSRLGLLVTEGCEHLAPTRSGDGKAPLVSSEMVLGIQEEVARSGEVVRQPSAKTILSSAQTLIDRGARCLVVAFTHSEFNPENERFVRQKVKEEYPRDYLGSVPVFLSSDISRRSGPAERINAAVLNAYIHSKLARLLYKAGEDLRQKFYRKNLFIVHNNGSVARVAKTRAIHTYNSGPAAGLLGARAAGRLYGDEGLISADMGGTSFDLGYVRNGRAGYSLRPDIEGFPVNVPMMEIRAVGAGGGSIASVADGQLQVGPRSAGALPGPVCFDLGGTEPTVTDADLILGVLDPAYFLGGTMQLNRDKAIAALKEKVADPLGLSVEAAALEIKSRIDSAMGTEIIRLRDRMGGDEAPLLVVYGGGGPAHCCHVAQAAGLKKILVTPYSAVFSAFSASGMDVGHRYDSRVDLPMTETTDFGLLDQAVQRMEKKANRDMRGEGFSPEGVELSLELFLRQEEEGPEIRLTAERDFYQRPEQIKDLLSRARMSLGGSEKPDGGVTITMVCLIARAGVEHYETPEVPPASEGVEAAKKGTRVLVLDAADGARPAPVYDRTLLTNGHSLDGPALIESEQTTILIPPGWRMGVDHYNNTVIEEGSGG